MFRCCDPQCTGLVTEEKFQCVLNDTLVPEAGITERQLDAVTNYYRAYEDKIDYKRMAEMFDSSMTSSLLYFITCAYRPKYISLLQEKGMPKSSPFHLLSRVDFAL